MVKSVDRQLRAVADQSNIELRLRPARGHAQRFRPSSIFGNVERECHEAVRVPEEQSAARSSARTRARAPPRSRELIQRRKDGKLRGTPNAVGAGASLVSWIGEPRGGLPHSGPAAERDPRGGCPLECVEPDQLAGSKAAPAGPEPPELPAALGPESSRTTTGGLSRREGDGHSAIRELDGSAADGPSRRPTATAFSPRLDKQGRSLPRP